MLARDESAYDAPAAEREVLCRVVVWVEHRRASWGPVVLISSCYMLVLGALASKQCLFPVFAHGYSPGWQFRKPGAGHLSVTP